MPLQMSSGTNIQFDLINKQRGISSDFQEVFEDPSANSSHIKSHSIAIGDEPAFCHANAATDVKNLVGFNN